MERDWGREGEGISSPAELKRFLEDTLPVKLTAEQIRKIVEMHTPGVPFTPDWTELENAVREASRLQRIRGFGGAKDVIELSKNAKAGTHIGSVRVDLPGLPLIGDSNINVGAHAICAQLHEQLGRAEDIKNEEIREIRLASKREVMRARIETTGKAHIYSSAGVTLLCCGDTPQACLPRRL